MSASFACQLDYDIVADDLYYSCFMPCQIKFTAGLCATCTLSALQRCRLCPLIQRGMVVEAARRALASSLTRQRQQCRLECCQLALRKPRSLQHQTC